MHEEEDAGSQAEQPLQAAIQKKAPFSLGFTNALSVPGFLLRTVSLLYIEEAGQLFPANGSLIL
jgi:hypothetical protein